MSAKAYYYNPHTKVPKDKMYWEYYIKINPTVFALFLRLKNVVIPLYTLRTDSSKHIAIYL